MTAKEEKLTVEYRRYRQQVFEEHSFLCDECDNTEWLRLYHPDDSLEALYEPDNAFVLCRGCHMKKYPNDGQKRRPGRGFDKFLKVSVNVLAQATGKCHETVRRHIRTKKVDPNDIISVMNWINKNRRKK